MTSIRARPSLERVTTGDLEALVRYSQAVRLIDRNEDDRGIRLLEEAVGIDSAFAMAWRKLGVVLGNRGEERARAVEALTKAYRHRDRLTERERHLTEAAHHFRVTGRNEEVVANLEALLELQPDDGWALNNLALAYWELPAAAAGPEVNSCPVPGFATS